MDWASANPCTINQSEHSTARAIEPQASEALNNTLPDKDPSSSVAYVVTRFEGVSEVSCSERQTEVRRSSEVLNETERNEQVK